MLIWVLFPQHLAKTSKINFGCFEECKNSIGWIITDLKYISPLVCMHKIIIEGIAKTNEKCSNEIKPNYDGSCKK